MEAEATVPDWMEGMRGGALPVPKVGNTRTSGDRVGSQSWAKLRAAPGHIKLSASEGCETSDRLQKSSFYS